MASRLSELAYADCQEVLHIGELVRICAGAAGYVLPISRQ